MTSIENSINNVFYYKIVEIKNHLYKKIDWDNHSGLMGGITGELLFFLIYYEFSKSKDILTYIVSTIEKIIFDYDYSKNGYSFAYGLSGIGWLIDIMKRKNYIESGSDDIFTDVEKIIYNDSIKDLNMGNYDYLSGGLGAAVYFLNKEIPSVKYIKDYLLMIDKIKIIDGDSYYIQKNDKKHTCDLGLSHGIPSIISFLINTYRKGIEIHLCKNLIRGFVHFLINNMQNVEKEKSFFPYSIDAKNKYSRLAWCYGDLSIGFVINEASFILNDMYLQNISNTILLYSAKRLDLSANMINDAGICHGSSGIAYIYNKLYKKTQNMEFKKASDYWYQKTIELCLYPDGIAGYKSFYKGSYFPVRGFLEGIAGIGLSLMSGIFDMDSIWDECLLLS